MIPHHRLHQFALIVAIGCACASNSSWAQEEHDLAKQLANPIASLISVPFQSNWDTHIGPARDGDRYYMNFQPVIPVSLDKDWNLISRTIVPFISQRNVFPDSGTQTGIGDTTQSFFFSPKAPGPGGLIWGVGPALFIPSDADRLLSSGKWGAGPTGVALIQDGGWTIGILANQNWSYAGEGNRPDVNQTFLQPFLSYTTKDAWTYTLDTESTYDWMAHQWSVPINFEIAKLVKFGTQPVQFQAGVRYWAENPDTGAHDLGARFNIIFLFPTGKKG